MFETTKEGLEIYKETVRGYVERWNEIQRMRWNKPLILRDGSGYTKGYYDYTDDDIEWQQKIQAEIKGMEKVLGIDEDEKTILFYKSLGLEYLAAVASGTSGYPE